MRTSQFSLPACRSSLVGERSNTAGLPTVWTVSFSIVAALIMTESRACTITRGEERTDTGVERGGENAETALPAKRDKAANPMTFKERTMMK